MDFDVDEFLCEIEKIMPDWINIGADSKKNNLPEPTWDKILGLMDGIIAIDKNIKIKLKPNLFRLRSKS